MNRQTREMLEAITAGRNWRSGTAAVDLGAVLGQMPYALQREVRVNGMLIATIGRHMFIRIPVTDKFILNTLNALLKTYYGDTVNVGMTKKHKQLFVTHPKPNALTGNIQAGTTFLDTNEWWEVPGRPSLDCTVIADER